MSFVLPSVGLPARPRVTNANKRCIQDHYTGFITLIYGSPTTSKWFLSGYFCCHTGTAALQLCRAQHVLRTDFGCCDFWIVADPRYSHHPHHRNHHRRCYFDLSPVLSSLPLICVLNAGSGVSSGSAPYGYKALVGEGYLLQCASPHQPYLFDQSKRIENNVIWLKHKGHTNETIPGQDGTIVKQGNYLNFTVIEERHAGNYSCYNEWVCFWRLITYYVEKIEQLFVNIKMYCKFCISFISL